MKTKNNYEWLDEGIDFLDPASRKRKIRDLEEERARINQDLEEAVALFAKESGNHSLRIKKADVNPFLLDGAEIGTDAFEETPTTGKIYIKPRK